MNMLATLEALIELFEFRASMNPVNLFLLARRAVRQGILTQSEADAFVDWAEQTF